VFAPDVTGNFVLRLEVFDGVHRAYDNVLVETIQGPNPLTPVTDLVARAKAGKIDLVWKPIPNALGYNVYRKFGTGAWTRVQEYLTSDFAVYADMGLTNGTPYSYLVRWLDAQGRESPASNLATATPSARAR
jgi:hypothetical protein